MRAVWRWLPLALVLSASSISRSVTAGQSPEPFELNELNELTIAQVQAALTEGRYTSRQITELYLKRIESIDRSGPGLHSVSETNPEALSIADALDAECIRPRSRGIPASPFRPARSTDFQSACRSSVQRGANAG